MIGDLENKAVPANPTVGAALAALPAAVNSSSSSNKPSSNGGSGSNGDSSSANNNQLSRSVTFAAGGFALLAALACAL